MCTMQIKRGLKFEKHFVYFNRANVMMNNNYQQYDFSMEFLLKVE